MNNPKEFHFKLPKYNGPELPEPANSWYPNIRKHHNQCTSNRNAKGNGKITTIVIHATAGSSSAGAMSVMIAHNASWHWLIPDEDEQEHGNKIWACAPEKKAGWHVKNSCSHPDVNNGNKNINYYSLGIEVVNSQNNDHFSEWQVRQVADVIRYAWSKYPEVVDIVSHAKLDPNRRSDPGRNFPWERLKELVLEPVPVVPIENETISEPQIIGPNGNIIECDATIVDGLTMAEVRPLLETLGFIVERNNNKLKIKKA